MARSWHSSLDGIDILHPIPHLLFVIFHFYALESRFFCRGDNQRIFMILDRKDQLEFEGQGNRFEEERVETE
ncbi:hypothetical protein Pmani_010739 [Petrolisthes manimaculis]|uniref:Uncharacterized protein n=1 Tax=Petrolisthes manimaculis TaxID=1843537 RepID=A0AAE1UGE2_9EUCA|nr:hypothetical protein Pmani_010739 [Petrolisthes manimaculis]